MVLELVEAPWMALGEVEVLEILLVLVSVRDVRPLPMPHTTHERRIAKPMQRTIQ